MTIYTYDTDTLAGMIARLDDSGERGAVLVVGATHAEATELLEYLDAKLGTRVVKRRRSTGNARLTLRHGVDVLACIPRSTRGRSARIVAVTAGGGDSLRRELGPASIAIGGTLVRVAALRPVHDAEPGPGPEEPAAEGAEGAEALENPGAPL